MKKLAALTILACLAAVAGGEDLTLYSEPGAGTVQVSVAGPASGFGTANPPVALTPHPAWKTITGAGWISSAAPRETNGQYGSWRLFTREFTLPDNAYNISATIEIAADNAYAVKCNGSDVGDSGTSGSDDGDGGVDTTAAVEWSSGPWPFQATWPTPTHSFTPTAGTNELEILVRNWPGTSGGEYENTADNPTGLLYKVVITYDVPIVVLIDIKPGSYPNCFNINDHGVIPVAIFGSESFDVECIVLGTLKFAGLDVRTKGNGQPQCSVKDVNGDGYPDLVCQFVDDSGAWLPENGTAAVWGALEDGTQFVGYDEICLTPAD